jgi:hypothetical protein
MAAWGTALLLSAFVLLIGGPIAYFYRQRRRRTEGMRQAAAELGLDFLPGSPSDPAAEFSRFHLFSEGRHRRVSNRMRGDTGGVDVEVFDYEYTFGTEESLESPRQTVLCFRVPGLELPRFTLRPKKVLHKVAALFGYQDLAIPGHPEFARNYLLRGPDEAALRGLFYEGLVAYYDARPGLSTEGCGDLLVYYRAARLVDPGALRAFLGEGLGLLALFR